jgi:3-deoxy-D-manno-octulosonic-acid transferase
MGIFYDISIYVLMAAFRLAALFHPKARLWVQGRSGWRTRLSAWRNQHPEAVVYWVHVASLGEFEQGRPLMEALREKQPDARIVLTFFSPSGYEIRKNYPHADLVLYLPADTPRNARDFVRLLRPQVVIFVKYEFWANYLLFLKKQAIPLLLISASFRSRQVFFRWYGAFWRRVLGCFTHFFVQENTSVALLQSIGFQNITLAGDTRIDRVLDLPRQTFHNDLCASFSAGHPVLLVGSSWPPDEAAVLPLFQQKNWTEWRLIIAPHTPESGYIKTLETRLEQHGFTWLRYSQGAGTHPDVRVLIIDNIGMLNHLYRYAQMAWIGGGFGKGIHNTLEPAAYGIPVLFGPRYHKFEEARQLIAAGAAFSSTRPEDAPHLLDPLRAQALREHAGKAARQWLEENSGATRKILSYLDQFY